MNSKTAVSAVLALTLATGQLAFAQGNSNRNDHDRDDHKGRQEQRRGDVAYHHDNRNFGRSHNEERSRGRGVGPGHEYYRGDRLPPEYRHRQYVVNDWRGHHLSAPPRGYQWVQSGGDYVLIAIATGIIAQLLLNQY
jgi:Ni/Co efflux regulator RcnB